jgi:hypothetical protein
MVALLRCSTFEARELPRTRVVFSIRLFTEETALPCRFRANNRIPPHASAARKPPLPRTLVVAGMSTIRLGLIAQCLSLVPSDRGTAYARSTQRHTNLEPTPWISIRRSLVKILRYQSHYPKP